MGTGRIITGVAVAPVSDTEAIIRGIGAVAIMTDTDNTGEEAVARYGAIRVLPPGP